MIEIKKNTLLERINPFHATDLFLYPLTTSKNLSFSVLRGYTKRQMA